ncbi:hypothetical protein SFUMM280S_11527 [Streptomyces fumanus]
MPTAARTSSAVIRSRAGSVSRPCGSPSGPGCHRARWRRVVRRAPAVGRHRAEQGHGRGGVGDGEVGDAGVAADHGTGVGDQGGQRRVGQAAAEDVAAGQPGLFGEVGHQGGLAGAAGDHDPQAAGAQFPGDGRVPLHRPAAGGGAGAGVQHHRAGRRGGVRRAGQQQVGGVGVDAVRPQQAAPAVAFVFLGVPGRSVDLRGAGVGERHQLQRAQLRQQLVAGRAVAVQVDGDLGRGAGPVQGARHGPAGRGGGQQPVDGAGGGRQGGQFRRGGQHDLVVRVGPAQRPQRGDPGEQVAQAQGAQDEDGGPGGRGHRTPCAARASSSVEERPSR